MSRLRVWLIAARPKTLPAAVAPVLLGTAMAFSDGVAHGPSALAALLGALLLQIGANFANDYSDFKKGADAEDRVGPLRVAQAGLVDPKTLLRATLFVFGLAVLVAALLTLRAGWGIIVVGVVSVLAGLGYTSGPRPYGYMGLGEVFVFVFFGPVAVGCTYYVQALNLPLRAIIAGFAPGMLAVAILVVNNLRDIESDTRAGKRTLAVRFGSRFARIEYLGCLLVSMLVPVGMVVSGNAHPGTLLCLLAILAARKPLITVLGQSSAKSLNLALAQTARLLIVFSVLFSIGCMM